MCAAQEKYWTLSKSPLPGFRHEFFTLNNGLKLHYVVNADDEAIASGNIAIFIHGKLRPPCCFRLCPASAIRTLTLETCIKGSRC